jgi:hypothetical protein
VPETARAFDEIPSVVPSPLFRLAPKCGDHLHIERSCNAIVDFAQRSSLAWYFAAPGALLIVNAHWIATILLHFL